MRALALALLVGAAAGATGAFPPQAPSRRERAPQPHGRTLCIYRSLIPSAGVVSSCRTEHDCRVGYYVGDPSQAVWFRPPPTLGTFPTPDVSWLTSTFAEVRVDCGHRCSFSYF